ncbi:TPA: SEC-C domain-containing protein [Burkholderia cenocepacia]|nr:SEC-C metal-binding domain-containing protein [Burkholderia cenocepacia]HEM7803750.1 SEC-C domain-containing protein [Burkholderia cenocepacia]
MTSSGRKVGRNERCPCGSGKKYKRCHGQAQPATSASTIDQVMQRGRLMLDRIKAQEKQREQQQGFGRPFISIEHNGKRFVAVGRKLMYSDKWKTVHDFLGHYLPGVLGAEWGNAELAKPLDERHPIARWYHYVCLLQQATIKEVGKVHSAPMTGAAEAWFQLAYDLYSLEHNAELQKKLINRIKHPEMFQGARYETFVAATMIRAGFDIEFEDEDDRESSHVEFTATCRKSGRKYSVEAKRRNVEAGGGSFRLGRLLQRALRKTAKHPRIVFIGIDFIDAQEETNQGDMPKLLAKALSDLRGFEGRSCNGQPLPPAYIFVTNRPHDLDLEGTNIQSALLAEGFQIPDFKMDTMYPGLRAAHQGRKAHADMHQLLDSVREHSAIPVTFDGRAPELAFADHPPARLAIGDTYLIPDSMGVARPGKLTSATVDEAQSIVFGAFQFDTGESVICTAPLSPEELAAYRRHPDTFFGVEIKVSRGGIKTPLELFYFFLEGFIDLPKERLLEVLAQHPDINKLKEFSREDLVEIYAEGCANAVLQQQEAKPA